MPPKKDRGMEMTRAQGQEMTRKVRARCTQTAQSPVNREGSTASARAANTTAGV